MKAEEAYALSRKYTENTVAGAGAVAGKPCQIQSITDITGGHRITFLWKDNSNVDHTSVMDVMDGKGIKAVAVNSSNHLIITYDDDTIVDAGEIDIHSAVNSVNGKTGNVDLTASDVGALSDSTYEEEIHGVNLFNVNALRDMPLNVEFNKTNTGIRISNTSAGTWRYVSFWITNIPKNTECLMSCDVLITSGKGKILVKDSETQASVFDINVEDGETFTKKFNTGNYNSLYLTMYCATDTAELGDVTYNNLMIRKADIEDSTYRPYNPQAIQNQLNAQGVLGVRNIMPSDPKTETYSGVTSSFDADGNIILNGTNTSAINVGFSITKDVSTNNFLTKAGMYKVVIKGLVTGTALWLNGYNPNESILGSNKYADGSYEFYYDPTTYSGLKVGISVSPSTTLVNHKFICMITLASDPDDTYVPYAMTNKELTEKVFEKRVLTSSDDLNNVTETGLYAVRDSVPANTPEGQGWGSLLVNKVNTNNIQQQFFKAGLLYQRTYGGATPIWNSWYKFTGTVVS